MSINFTYNGPLDPQQHQALYIERDEDARVRQNLERVGTECMLVSLIGAHYAGKTSLIYRLHYDYGAVGGWVPVLLDLSTWNGLQGEQWYQHLVVACCEALPKSMGLSVDALRAHCAQKYIATPFSAQGWTELVYLACTRLAGGQRLLLSLDGITRMPHSEWGPLFTAIRAIHQASRSPNTRPEYRRLGMTLSGAFVPNELITAENSPFNVSVPLYLLPVSVEKLAQLCSLLAQHSIALDADALQALYRWSGGVLVFVQRFCAEIVQLGSATVSAATIAEIADAISASDAYLHHALARLKQEADLVRYVRRLLDAPLRFNRTLAPIAKLEIMGVICYDSKTKSWGVTNAFYEQALRQYFLEQEEQPMTGLEFPAAVVVGKAIDFLFDQAGKIMQQRREARASTGKADDTPPQSAQPTAKQEVQTWQPQQMMLKDMPREIEATLALIETYRGNLRQQEAAIAMHGDIALAPPINQNLYFKQIDAIKDNTQKLKTLVEQVYGKKITLVGLE